MIKKITNENELMALHALSCYAFNIEHNDAQRAIFLELLTHTDNYAVYNELDEVSSKVISFPFEVSRFGTSVKMAGIGNVSTYPEARGSGGIRQLFTRILKDLNDEQVALSYLAPFSQLFYRKFGYERALSLSEERIPQSVMAQFPPEKKGKAMRVTWDDVATQRTMKDLYGATLGQVYGSVVREDWWWEYVMASHEQWKIGLVKDEQGVAVGYVIYELSGSTVTVHECVYTTLFGLKKILTFVSSHSGNFSEFVFRNMKDDTYLDLFTEAKEIGKQTHDYMMARIVSLDSFLLNYPVKDSELEFDVTIGIEDELCPWNHGTFRWSVSNGNMSLDKVSDEPKEGECGGTIQRWTQVLMGVHTIEKSCEYEWLTVKDQAVIQTLSCIIQPVTPRLFDYF